MERTKTYLNYCDEDIVRYAAEVKSMAQLLEKLGLRPAGGNYSQMRKHLHRLGLECEHWTGQGWNKGQRMKDWSGYKRSNRMKKHLVRDRGHKCESCGLTEWLKKPIPLEVDHADGDRTNNDPSNLRLLCCNCHALTPTWRGRANKGQSWDQESIDRFYKKNKVSCTEF